MRLSAIALFALVVAVPLRATSLMNIGPLAKANSVSVEEITIGEPLTRDGVKAVGLFDSTPGEIAKFKAELKQRLEQQLRSAGIKVAPGSPFALIVSVYGGKYEARQDAPNVFLLELAVAEIGSECASGPDVTKMGVASDESLARTVEDIAAEEVQTFIHQRAEYRKSIAPAAN